MFPQLNHIWKCVDCGHKILGCQDERQLIRPNKCPECGGENIEDDGPIVHDGPDHEKLEIKY